MKKSLMISGAVLALLILGSGYYFLRPTTTALACQPDWTKHETSLMSFCYKAAWGTPTVVDETHKDGKGNLYHLSFSNDAATDNIHHTTPDVWIETTDFAPSAADYTLTCFSCINFSQDESTIIQALNMQDQGATLEKVKVAGKDAVRVRANYVESAYNIGPVDTVSYYIPNAMNGYHVQASIASTNAFDLDAFAKQLQIN